jgi:hypothetical protein
VFCSHKIIFSMPKRTYSIAPKKEVAEFMKDGNSAWTAAEHFGHCEKTRDDHPML